MYSINLIKYNSLFVWILFLLFAASHGCVLEDIDIVEYGSYCESAYILIDEEACYRGDCAGYDIYFNKNRCPQDYPICLQKGGDYYCTNDCDIGYHIYSYENEEGNLITTCEKNSALHCGKHDNNCYEDDKHAGWFSAECTKDNQCKLIDCDDTYKKVGELCVTLNECCGTDCKNCKRGGNLACYANNCVDACPEGQIRCDGVCLDPTTSKTYCGATANCETDRKCGYGQNCVNSKCECNEGEDYCENSCMDIIANIQHCGSCENNCEQMTGWMSGKCEGGKCKASECSQGTHIVNKGDGSVVCESDSATACGSPDNDCTQIPGWADGYCDKTNCVLTECAKTFFLHDNECLKNTADNCGALGKKCQAGHTCDLENGGCLCDNGLIECDDTCVDTQVSDVHCGSCGHPCNVQNAKNSCNGGKCYFTCETGYVETADGTGCEPFVCNHGDKKCDINRILRCESNVWIEEQVCTTTKVNASGICMGGSSPYCTEQCNTDFTDCGGTCYNLNNDINHCQSCGQACSTVENGYPVCRSTGCDFECNGDYIKRSWGCEKKICNEGTHRCDDKNYQTCMDNNWVTTITCKNPSNGTSTCNAEYSSGCVTSCNPGYSPCSGQCVDTQNDDNNCGGCGKVCSTGCRNGQCGCSWGQVNCGGICKGSQAQGIVHTQSSVMSEEGYNAGVAYPDEIYNIYGVYSSYYVIGDNGNKMYIPSRNVYLLPARGRVTASSGVLIRPCPGKECDAVDFNAILNVVLTVHGYTIGSDGQGWYIVNCVEPRYCDTGYAHSDYINLFDGAANYIPDCN